MSSDVIFGLVLFAIFTLMLCFGKKQPDCDVCDNQHCKCIPNRSGNHSHYDFRNTEIDRH